MTKGNYPKRRRSRCDQHYKDTDSAILKHGNSPFSRKIEYGNSKDGY